MQNTIVHYEGVASLEAAATKVKPRGARIKIGLDVHARLYVAVAQYDHLLPKPAQRLSQGEFVPWVEALLARSHSVHVVSARAAPLVERANLDALGPASACLDHHPSANGASSALKLARADQCPNK
jgi:hypothetical protein